MNAVSTLEFSSALQDYERAKLSEFTRHDPRPSLAARSALDVKYVEEEEREILVDKTCARK
jgi:hypothetical protein